ncbi:MAG: 50S ribosomal protein L29 [Patescibacteria group bacterium]
MKLKDKQTFRTNSLKELKNLLEKARNELFLLKLDKAQNKLKNTRSIFLKRKEIALILTLIREKELVEKSL